MKIASLSIFLFFVLNISCSSNNIETIVFLWVDSQRVSCQGVGEQSCYYIQDNETINENDWSLFYSNIEGFDEQYETGYIYNISVITTHIDNPPADASSIKYVLKKIISKKLNE